MKVFYIENNDFNCLLFMAQRIDKFVIMKGEYTGLVDKQNIQINRDNIVDIECDLNKCAADERDVEVLYRHAPFIYNIERIDANEAINMLANAEYSEKIHEIADLIECEEE